MNKGDYLFSGDPNYTGPLPALLRQHAITLLTAVRTLMDYPTPSELNGLPAIPAAQLLTHSLELFLKLALLKRGYNEQELRGPKLRHNLVQLMEECEGIGVYFSDEHRNLIIHLNEIHENHAVRYTIASDGMWMPFTMRQMVDLAMDFLMASHPSGRVERHV